MSRIHALVATAVLAIGAVAPASAQIVNDGGFEQHVVSGYVYTPTTSTWSFLGGSGLINGFFSAFNTPSPLSGQGNQVAFLQANARRGLGVISTSIVLPTSGNYFLSFLNAGRSSGCCGGNTLFDVLLGGSQIGQFSSVTDEQWSSKGTQFYAAAGTYNLSFTTNTKLPGDNTTFFDNISVVTATPEPGSLVLLATGLFAVTGIAVRRKRNS